MGLLGAHVSIAGGVENAPERGHALKCETIQIFTKNQRQWTAKELSEESIKAFKEKIKLYNLRKPVAHDSYLINLASLNEETFKKSKEAFMDEAFRAYQLGIPYLVFHPGSNPDIEEGIKRISEVLNLTISKVKDVILLIEITAGQGNAIGRRFEEIAKIIEQVKDKSRIGVCFDTAHAFESGYDIRTEKSYHKTFEDFDKIIGLDYLKCFHLNDSKTPLGSNVDRHEHIGKGEIGLKAFKLLVNDPRFKEHPMILETPGGEKYYEENLRILRKLIKSSRKR